MGRAPASATPAEPGGREETAGWHQLPVDRVAERLGTSPARGLSSADAAARLARCGPNALPERKRRPGILVFLDQFRSPLIYLLFVAAGLALALGETRDSLVILGVLAVNAVIGAVQEGRAEHSMLALRRMAGLRARALRDGEERSLEARQLVPGDVLLLAAGDAVGADARLAEAARLEVSEAALTGESLPVAKGVAPLPPETSLSDRRNMIYAGTHVAAGRGRALVVATGPRTEVGRIAALAEAVEDERTPLEWRISQFGRYLAAGALGVFALILAAGLARGLKWSQILLVAISQLVSTVPEGLPVAMTVALAVGMRRMAERRAIVRRLAAVESLGSTTVICTDKTGTLTRNEMTATAIYLPAGRWIRVTGAGYSPEGHLLEEGRPLPGERDAELRPLLEVAVLCNDASLLPPGPGGGAWSALGDPTEAAFLAMARKGGLDASSLRGAFPRRGELPFSAETKMMATWHQGATGARVAVKGGAEMVLDLCGSVRVGDEVRPLQAADRRALSSAAEAMARRALRVLAFAEVPGLGLDQESGFATLRGRATFLGLVGQEDPPRSEARGAVRQCQSAGIRVVMVTGDHRTTGLAVAQELGIAGAGDVALDGRALEAMDDVELGRELARISVFARVQPAQKLRIVEALQDGGEVVAMTGDGVNDAPALAQADVGVAMGIAGTEVAKEASEIVVTDDNFATLVGAVNEGRVVYRNLKKAILLLLSTGLAEILVLVLAVLLGYPLPFAAVQILWNNVVTEGTITVNLAMEPPEGDEMRLPPIPRGEPILTRSMLGRMAAMSLAITAATLGLFFFRLGQGVPLAQVQTATFTLLAVCEWFNVLNCRSATRSALGMSPARNPWLLAGLLVSVALQTAVVYFEPLGRVFRTVPLPFSEVLVIGAVGSLVLWVEEARKLLARRRLRRRGET